MLTYKLSNFEESFTLNWTHKQIRPNTIKTFNFLHQVISKIQLKLVFHFEIVYSITYSWDLITSLSIAP